MLVKELVENIDKDLHEVVGKRVDENYDFHTFARGVLDKWLKPYDSFADYSCWIIRLKSSMGSVAEVKLDINRDKRSRFGLVGRVNAVHFEVKSYEDVEGLTIEQWVSYIRRDEINKRIAELDSDIAACESKIANLKKYKAEYLEELETLLSSL